MVFILSGINLSIFLPFYLLNPAMQKMCNTLNILCPKCREQDESHPHFIFYCKLPKVALY